MKSVLTLTAAALFAVSPILRAQQSAPPPPPAAEAKPASKASVAGKWTLTVEIDNQNPSTLDVKLTDKKVSGMLSAPTGELPITGEYTDGTLKFSITIESQQGTFPIRFSGTLKDDDTMAGTMDYGQGSINWRAVRVKDAK